MVSSRRFWRIISCAAAKQMRWVKPSMTSESPSCTKRETASRIDMTLARVGHPLGAIFQSPPTGLGATFQSPPTGEGHAGTRTCEITSSRMRNPIATSSSSMTSGGASRNVLRPQPKSNKPLAKCSSLELGYKTVVGLLGRAVADELHADHQTRRHERHRSRHVCAATHARPGARACQRVVRSSRASPRRDQALRARRHSIPDCRRTCSRACRDPKS